MNIGSIVKVVIMLLVLIFACVGLGGPIMTRKTNSDNYIDIMFTKTVTVSNGHKTTTDLERGTICSSQEVYDRATVALVFGLFSIVCAAGAIVVSVLEMFIEKLPKFISIILIVLNSVFVLIAWAVAESLRSSKFCGAAKSYADLFDFEFGWGNALLVVSWCISVVAIVLAVVFMVIM